MPVQQRRRPEEMPDWLLKLEDRHIQTLHLEDVSEASGEPDLGPDPFITRKEV